MIALTIGLLATGALSLAIVADYWLYTWENVPIEVPSENTTGTFITQYMLSLHSGLWRLCVDAEGKKVDSLCLVLNSTFVWILCGLF